MHNDINTLEEQLRLREFEIELLKEIADAVGSQLHFDSVLQLIAERARTLVQADTLLIPILTENSTYTYKAGCGEHADEIVGTSLPSNYGLCGWVLSHHRPWWRGTLNELGPEERTQWETHVGTAVLVPLIGKQGILGGISGLNKTGGGDFTQRDFDLLTLFASQVSIAMENALSYEALALAKADAERYHLELEHLNLELTRANQGLEHLALYDHLTELPNRALIQDAIQDAIETAESHAQIFSVLVLDLDHFKEINDTLGHAIGDKLLKDVSERFKKVLRKADTVGRLGGDEFAVILPGADIDAAIRSANQLLTSLSTPFQYDNNTLSASSSLGIAVYPEHGADISTLLKHADVAMYMAKRNRSGYAIYDINEDPHNPDRLALLGDLHHALARRELVLHYQPKINLRTGEFIGVEALARWNHSARGMIGPDEFIPLLEQTGMIRGFAYAILDMAMEQCAQWRRLGYTLNVAVNLSAHNVRDPSLAAHFIALLQKWSVDHNMITLEITESAVMKESAETNRVLAAFHDSGVRLSIDDFGTGYSSLSRLKRMPVSELKIDRSFVKDMLTDSDDAVIVQSTIDLAHNLGLSVTAEGVEDSRTYRRLIELGCDHAQGYYISPPLSDIELIEFLKKSYAPKS